MHTFLLQAAAPAPDGIASLFPLLIALVMVVFFIVPSYLQRRKQTQFLKELTTGTVIYTNSGIIGTIVKLETNEVTIQVDEKSRMRILRSAIAGVYNKKADA